MSYMLLKADARRIPLADGSVHMACTSPPYYGLRDYGVAGQIGLERTPEQYIEAMVGVFREVHRVLRDDGTLWLNMGDSYNAYNGNRNPGPTTLEGRAQAGMPDLPKGYGLTAEGLKPKDLILMPARLALALQSDGWYVRQEIIWAKRNCMPESVRDRPSRSHEMVYLLTKKPRYFYDHVATRTPQKTAGKRHEGASGYREGHPSKGGIKARALNPLGAAERSVWSLSSTPFKGAHFATMPPALAIKCIRLGTSEKGVCPRCGSPWVRIVERKRRPTRPGTDSKVYEPDPARKQDGTGNRRTTGFNARWKASQEVGNRDPERHVTEVSTLGWESSCTCLEPRPVPAIVFDPFAGAATTLVAAEHLGRHAIGTELSEEYLGISARRLERPHAPPKMPARPSEPARPLFKMKQEA